MRVLGLDLGAKRIGIAISDSEASIAFPIETLPNKGREQSVIALSELIAEREVERVVIGLPIHMNGRKGPEAKAALAFASALAKRSGVTVDTLDERLTSSEAERSLRAVGHRRERKKALIDSVAASILLRAYLEIHRDELRASPNAGVCE